MLEVRFLPDEQLTAPGGMREGLCASRVCHAVFLIDPLRDQQDLRDVPAAANAQPIHGVTSQTVRRQVTGVA